MEDGWNAGGLLDRDLGLPRLHLFIPHTLTECLLLQAGVSVGCGRRRAVWKQASSVIYYPCEQVTSPL